MLAWHRRAGKDSICLNWAATAMVTRPAGYWHMLPQQAQAQKAIWKATNPHTGKRLIDQAFPVELRKKTLEDEMFIELINGATWQVVGSDNYNSLVGSTPAGIVNSEAALADPAAMAYLEPILEENGGWQLEISTARGRNHFKRSLDSAVSDPKGFGQVLTAEQTGVFTPEQLEQIRARNIERYGEMWGEALFRQEYLCSFDAAIRGAYYGSAMEAAEADGRVGSVPYDPKYPVITAWDLGIGDHTVIWCAQQVGTAIHVIDCIANSGVDLAWFVKELGKRPYVFKEHILPHDGRQRELGTGVTRQETLESLGCRPTRIAANISRDDGINAVRLLIPRMKFDRDKCARLIEAMAIYRADYDEKLDTLRPVPVHDWSSHFADAGRYLAVGLREQPAGIAGPAQLPRRRMAA